MTTNEPLAISDVEIKQIREALGRYEHADPNSVRYGYSPKKLQGESCIGFQGDNPMILALELAATFAARVMAQETPDRGPAEHESTFQDHLDYLREAVAQLGELGVDRLLEDQVWFWPGLVSETPASRKQLVADVRAQVEAEVARRAEELVRQGYEAGYRAALHPHPEPQPIVPTRPRRI